MFKGIPRSSERESLGPLRLTVKMLFKVNCCMDQVVQSNPRLPVVTECRSNSLDIVCKIQSFNSHKNRSILITELPLLKVC